MVGQEGNSDQISNTKPVTVDSGKGDVSLNLSPEKFDLKTTGWDSFAEYLLDISGLVPKPLFPRFPGNPLRYKGTDYLSHQPVRLVENHVVNLLTRYHHGTDAIEAFKQDMVDYRQKIRDIAKIWRSQGLL